MRSRSDSNMNRRRRSDECLRTSQHTDVLRCLFEEKGRLADDPLLISPTLHSLRQQKVDAVGRRIE